MSGKAIYACLRRKNQTYFVMFDSQQHKALYLKEQVALALGEETKPEEMMVKQPDGTVLNDDDALDHLQNEQVLHLVFQIADDEWEPVDLVEMDTSD
mmetsp:Transcript_27612/g.40602  ORF Transcript_27612/g.40602 Transcript_27612/m.40602 type:complete len:97 (+) Transcript_27612:134-424(+)|eukprot:CAMPEP_0194027650 /NCGR_PEP_ID=MMETSP0009_2-20130614/1772_1 /TAXON_ID=210454 /ORGANISM="Grammatophora oceanica, Strain CCMP 410" /LENGTH=96 /DNA_ID=CAMNT_0038666791 /DNA_START=72 /DNA_END=362 /DNA_ORIENTATION=-